jgi:hypothetical protein
MILSLEFQYLQQFLISKFLKREETTRRNHEKIGFIVLKVSPPVLAR